eukprot:GHVT01100466.1.p2 GENE.GHVT01100466.1~~GHVT01100466.1.p2  ORF type:complete len:110 (-),score=15.66 GHVT01100466.1:685-1014(-)
MFIRNLKVVDLMLSLEQTHDKTRTKCLREVSVAQVQAVRLGSESKEFASIESLIKAGKETAKNMPDAKLCCVVDLPGKRTLALVFPSEDNRNSFVFFLRALVKSIKANK